MRETRHEMLPVDPGEFRLGKRIEPRQASDGLLPEQAVQIPFHRQDNLHHMQRGGNVVGGIADIRVRYLIPCCRLR